MQRRNILKTIGAGSLALAWPNVHAKPFPDRPVRVVLPYAAGSTVETNLRDVGELFKASTGQPLLMDARPGGAGIVAAQLVKGAAPDGYTLLGCNTTMFTINPHTRSNLSYDPDKDFRPVTNVMSTSLVMAINSSVPAGTLAEFVKWSKANPEKVSYASFSAGNSSHFVGVLLNDRAGLSMLHVPYTGSPPAVTALLGGSVQVAFVPVMAVKQHVEAGRVKVLAIAAPVRSGHIPHVPTFRELGYPDLEVSIWAGLAAPINTPDAVVARLNAEFTRILAAKEIKDKWFPRDFEPQPSTSQEFKALYQTDSMRWAEAVRISGFKATD